MAIAIFALVFSKICFSFITIIWKNLRRKGVKTISNLAMFIFSVPFLFILGYFVSRKFNLILTEEYIIVVLLWLIPVFLSNIFDVYLLKFQALTEQSSYKLAMATIVAILIDLFFFKTKYSIYIFLAIILFFIGGYILTKSKIPKSNRLPLTRALTFVFMIAGLDVIGYAIYKEGLLIQPTIFFHIIITQSILFTMFFIIGRKSLTSDFKDSKILPKDIVGVNVLIFAYLILEAIAVKEFPLSIVVSVSILPLVLYSLFDFKNREINLSYKSILALVLVSIGIIFIAMN